MLDLLGLADEDADGEHRLRHGKRRGRAARALGEDEAGEVCAGLGSRGNVLLAGEPADLHEGPGEELGELGPRDRPRA